MWRLMCILVPFVLLNAIYSVQSVEARHRTTKEVKRSTTISSVTNGNARTVNSSRVEQSSPSPLVSAQDEKMSPDQYYRTTEVRSSESSRLAKKCTCGCGREDCGCGREPGSAINQSSTQPLLPERQVYYATTPKYHTTDVDGITVRQHLIQSHGYTREQLRNKSHEQLRTLHDQAHAG